MQEKCNKCALPGIIEAIRAKRDIGRSALGNAKLAESPAEAKPYREIVNNVNEELTVLNNQLGDFLGQWGYCDDCHLK